MTSESNKVRITRITRISRTSAANPTLAVPEVSSVSHELEPLSILASSLPSLTVAGGLPASTVEGITRDSARSLSDVIVPVLSKRHTST